MKRAIRRHHIERLKAKRIKEDYWCDKMDNPRLLGICVNTPHPCSCYVCGNPRKHFNEKTIQEKRLGA